MSDDLVIVERDGRVGVVLMNRPKQLNALSGELMDAVVGALEELDGDAEIRAIVLGGNERAFAAGADIAELASGTPISLYESGRIARWDAIRAVRTPIVAAVSGFCLGGGCELAMLCDLIVASETARFGQPEINLGVLPGAGGTQRLTRAVGKAVAMDMILTGRMLTAREALDFGLVARVVAKRGVARRGEARGRRDRSQRPGLGAAREGGGRPGVRGAPDGRGRVRAARLLSRARIRGCRRGAERLPREAAARLQGTLEPPALPRRSLGAMRLRLTALAIAALCAGGLAATARADPPPSVFAGAGVFVDNIGDFPGRGRSPTSSSVTASPGSRSRSRTASSARTSTRSGSTSSASTVSRSAPGVWSGRHPLIEAVIASVQVQRYGLDFYIADAERTYESNQGGGWRSANFVRDFRQLEPTLPAALVTLGAAPAPYVLPIDYAAWRNAGFELLPEAYYNKFSVYRPDLTVAHALRAGWTAAQVHPVIGIWGRYPAVNYLPWLESDGARGFSVFLADQAQAADYDALSALAHAASGLP